MPGEQPRGGRAQTVDASARARLESPRNPHAASAAIRGGVRERSPTQDPRAVRVVHPRPGQPARVQPARPHPGHPARRHLRRLVALPRAQGRAHRERLHPGGGHLGHPVQVRARVRRQGRQHPREQPGPDRGLRRRVHRLRGRRDHARHPDPRLRPRADARGPGRGPRRTARDPDDDPAAPGAHRAAARHPQVPGGHGVRRGAQGGRLRGVARSVLARGQGGRPGGPAARAVGRHHLHRLRRRAGVQGGDVGVPRLEGHPRTRVHQALHRRLDLGRDLARTAGRGLHHRPQDRGHHVRGRRARVPGADPDDQVLRRAHRRTARPRHHPDRRHGPGPDPQRVRALHRRRRGRRGRHHLAGALAAHHLARAQGGPARRHRRARRRRPASHRARPADECGVHRHPRAGGGDRVRQAAPHEPARRRPDRRIRVPVRHRVLAPGRRDRLVVQPDLGHDRGDAAPHLPHLPRGRLDRRPLLRHRALGRRHRVHRGVERRRHLAGT